MKIVAGGTVRILTHDGGLAYESLEVILEKLPEDCIIRSLCTDMTEGLIKEGPILPHVVASFV